MDDGYKELFKILAEGTDADLSSVRSNDLLGCPFCSSNKIGCEAEWIGDTQFWWRSCNSGCGARGPASKSLNEATELWQHRVIPGKYRVEHPACPQRGGEDG